MTTVSTPAGVSPGQAKVAEILLVEDSPTDALLTREALASSRLANRLHVVADGVEALAFLRGEGPYSTSPKPDLILLDLNLPRMDGREVLREIRSDPALSLIPVVVLTTSQADTDVVAAYGLRANCFISKPVDFDNFIEVIRRAGEFWFAVVTLPPK